jgi:hypothetical protein
MGATAHRAMQTVPDWLASRCARSLARAKKGQSADGEEADLFAISDQQWDDAMASKLHISRAILGS